MTDDDVSTQKLLSSIEARDHRFRLAWVFFMFIAAVILFFLVALSIKTLDGVEKQLKQQETLLREQKENTAKISAQMDCIARFFAERNRQEAVINDLEQCRIMRPDGSVVDMPAPSTAQSPATAPQNSGQSTQNPQQPNQPNNPSSPSEPPPVEIIGVPVCVPLTGICLR